MAGDGWVKMSRGLLHHPIMQHAGLFHLWSYCLLKANWKDSDWLIPGTTQVIKVPRGSFITGRHALHKALYPKKKASNPSESTLWRWIESLEQMQCITVQNLNNRASLVTVCKYKTYQDMPEEKRTTGEQLPDNCRTTAGQLVNTIEERNNSKNSLSLSFNGREFQIPESWQHPRMAETLQAWADNVRANGKRFDEQQLIAVLSHHTSLGWDADRLIRGITLSLSKSCQTTILDPDREQTSQFGKPTKSPTDAINEEYPNPQRARA